MKRSHFLLIIGSLVVLFCVFSISMCNTNRLKDKTIVELRENGVNLELEKQKLVDSIEAYREELKVREQQYFTDVRQLNIWYKNSIKKLKSEYEASQQNIKKLPANQQVALLSYNLIESKLDTTLFIKDEDTCVNLNMSGVEEINSTYLALEYKDNLLIQCDNMVDSLNIKIKEGIEILQEKDKLLQQFDELSKTNDLLLKQQDSDHRRDIKLTKKKMHRRVVIGGVVGLILGMTVVTVL